MYISYRSYLKSCNYRCPYCPFAKRKETEKQLQKDKEALEKFYQFVKQLKTPVSLFFTPYGEILTKEYYWSYFAELSKIPVVMEIGSQTNLSFPVQKMFAVFQENGGKKEKLRLWCTYHPDMVLEDVFLESCTQLEKYHIGFSVGAVAESGKLGPLVSIKEKLPKYVYFWCNAVEGKANHYTEEEKNILKYIDSHFENEIAHFQSQPEKCTGGREAIFIESDGSYYSCHISRYKIGNIYQLSDAQILNQEISDWKMINQNCMICKAKECSCYLAYRLREDLQDRLPMNGYYRIG